MRVIEKKMINAINSQSNFALDNTTVQKIDDVNMAVYLHGNEIATVNSRTGFVMVNKVTLKQWPSNTTKSRLRALGMMVNTIKGQIFLNGVAL